MLPYFYFIFPSLYIYLIYLISYFELSSFFNIVIFWFSTIFLFHPSMTLMFVFILIEKQTHECTRLNIIINILLFILLLSSSSLFIIIIIVIIFLLYEHNYEDLNLIQIKSAQHPNTY